MRSLATYNPIKVKHQTRDIISPCRVQGKFMTNKNNPQFLNAANCIFCISFRYNNTSEKKFLCTPENLMGIIKQYDNNRGIEYIKVFEPSKMTFQRIAKERILKIVDWHTESYIYLQNHYYFN